MSDMGDESVVDTAAVVAALAGEQYDTPTDDSAEEYDNEQNVDPGEDDTEYENDDAPAEDDLGPDPDLSDLDPAQRAFLEKRIADLRGDYTRKTTKAAEALRVLEAAGGNAEELQDAYEFAQALQNDPAVRARLFAALQAEQAEQSGTQPETPADDPFSDLDLPPEIRDRLSKVDALEARFAALDAREAEYAAQKQFDAYVQESADDLTGQWNDIIEAYPDLLGSNAKEAAAIEAEIFALGATTEGNLAAALDIYRGIEARAQNRLIGGAASVQGGALTPPRGSGHSTEPPKPIETFKEAGAAALEYLSQLDQ